jgi:hypothetical protein
LMFDFVIAASQALRKRGQKIRLVTREKPQVL